MTMIGDDEEMGVDACDDVYFVKRWLVVSGRRQDWRSDDDAPFMESYILASII